eukprot:m.9527 g.9527  ORF g.9527 m.9527 type:complete len:216 (+) comp6940_c0_seq1:185-832(+)
MMAPDMKASSLLAALLSFLSTAHGASELTFELGPNAEECFYSQIEESSKVTFEFQVVYGGRLDVDARIIKLNNQNSQEEIYNADKSETGSHTFTAHSTGEYGFCFSNRMSTVAHKTVYLDVVIGNDDPLIQDAQAHHQTFTQMETSLINNHDALRRIIQMQTHHRIREATHRYTAEYMNERVQFASAAEALVLIILSLCQILYLRSLFSDKRDKW